MWSGSTKDARTSLTVRLRAKVNVSFMGQDNTDTDDQSTKGSGRDLLMPLMLPEAINSYPPSVNPWEVSMAVTYREEIRKQVFSALRSIRSVAHLDMDRHLAVVAGTADRDKDQLMRMTSFDPPKEVVEIAMEGMSLLEQARLGHLMAGVEQAERWGREMRRGVHMSLKLNMRPLLSATPEDKEDSFLSDRGSSMGQGVLVWVPKGFPDDKAMNEADIAQRATSAVKSGRTSVGGDKGKWARKEKICWVFTPLILVTVTEEEEEDEGGGLEGGGAESWWWTADVFLERFSLMRAMKEIFDSATCRREPGLLDLPYPPQSHGDPFRDTPQDELAGVTFLYPDSLRYLLDVKETLPLIGYAGRDLGALMKVHLRCWIDAIDAVPEYLTVDKETRLEDFIGQTCIIMIHFDWLLALNPLLCSSVYVAFKFFYHSRQYCTPRYPGISPNPTLNSSVRVEQRVTTDFIDFIKGGSIEFEVFGKRRLPLASDNERPRHRVGAPVSFMGVMSGLNRQKSTNSTASDPSTYPPFSSAASFSNEGLTRQLEEARANLRATEKQLQRSRRAADCGGSATQKVLLRSVDISH